LHVASYVFKTNPGFDKKDSNIIIGYCKEVATHFTKIIEDYFSSVLRGRPMPDFSERPPIIFAGKPSLHLPAIQSVRLNPSIDACLFHAAFQSLGIRMWTLSVVGTSCFFFATLLTPSPLA
jgi:hypothetical protein